MTQPASGPNIDRWTDAMTAACLFAVMPHALAGVRLRSGASPVRQRWLELLLSLLEQDTPVQRIHPQISDAALLGGLDLPATLARGHTVFTAGALSKADQGVVILTMAERASTALGARIAAALDTGSVRIERDGLTAQSGATFGLVALDEGEQDEVPPAVLLDRLSLELDLSELSMRDVRLCSFTPADVAAARLRSSKVHLPEKLIEAIASTALALGILPLRTSLLACAMARASAALFNREEVDASDAALSARLVLAPRAQQLPQKHDELGRDATPPTQSDAQPQSAASPQTSDAQSASDRTSGNCNAETSDETSAETSPDLETIDRSDQHDPSPGETLLEATVASIPADLLDRLLAKTSIGRASSAGRSGQNSVNASHGRALGTPAPQSSSHARLDLVSTLRAAAPWQALRRNEQQSVALRTTTPLVQVRRQDFRSRRYIRRSSTTTVFAVDASGSAALHRLAETKGAVELILAQCYVRRDQVAVISFRDHGATLVLPPTRSLVRAKRSLASLAGGGGTPLAAALDAVMVLADTIQRRGDTPIVVVLSDGRANIARDQSRNREAAHQDALHAALNLKRLAVTSLFIDTAMRPGDQAASIARQMGARYMALPFVDAQSLSRAVLQASI